MAAAPGEREGDRDSFRRRHDPGVRVRSSLPSGRSPPCMSPRPQHDHTKPARHIRSIGRCAGGCSADCEAGEHCELVQVTCVRAPCPPLPMCVPDEDGKEPAPRDCDPRKITCKRTPPECPELQVPSVDGSCYGECVDVNASQCTGPDACPLSEKYTCNMSAKHCTPYLR